MEAQDDFSALRPFVRDSAMGLRVLGGGANLLAADGELDATVISLEPEDIRIEGQHLFTGTGNSIIQAVQAAGKAGLAGLEWATAVPGTWGGALTMNAGAYGSETGTVVEWAEVLTPDFSVVRVPAREVTWNYRHTTWPVPVLLFLRAALRLVPGDSAAIKQRQLEITRERNSKFPKAPCAGSVFKNPPGDKAGRLLEACGLKNAALGGAKVSEEHANIFINRGGTALDMIRLIVHARRAVERHSGVRLEPEVVLWDALSYDDWEESLKDEPAPF